MPRAVRRRAALRLAGPLAALLCAGAAGPPPSPAQLEQLERERAGSLAMQKAQAAAAAEAAAESDRLAAARVAAAAKLRASEQASADLAERVADLTERRRALAEAERRHAADLTPLLPVLERLSLYPAETLLAVPTAPEESLRGVAVLQGIGRSLARDAARLHAEQAELARLQRALETTAPLLVAAEKTQAAEAAALDRQIEAARARAASAHDAAAAAAVQAAAAAARAETLRAVLDRLAAAEAGRASARHRPRAEAPAATPHPRGPGLGAGSAVVPVAGRVVRGFGAPTAAGPAEDIAYRAAPAARVVAPCAGSVVFAAPFRSYGQVLILDCGDDFHFVLAGMAQIVTAVGQTVLAGEPIGAMRDWDPGAPVEPPTLHVELRRGTQPIDPGPWLRGAP